MTLRAGITLLFAFISTLAWATPTTDDLAKRATCTPVSAGDAGTDDVPAIEAAFKSCGNGRRTLSFAGCRYSQDVGRSQLFWNGVSTVISINAISGGMMRSVTGTGIVDGNGVPYWIAFAANSSYARPTLVSITGASKGITISNLRFKNPANVFHSVNGGSTNILYENLRMDATSTATAIAKNTDGFDVGASTFVTIKNTTVVNQPGSNFALVSGITCTGSHGLSVGSLGGGAGSTDAGGSAHGVATVTNVTWSDITVQNCDYAVQIQSCYEAANTSNCISNTDKLTAVTFENFSGTTSTKFSPVVANINCAPAATCDVALKNFAVKPPSGTTEVLCSNIDDALGVTCSGAASG
ncbi:extracellular exo-polygalacturonase [Mycena alexandri]|uniref:Extracellular exo-polygalacturonase n=1 Tax=Mycena alexandri TaxID=1745969 RepID=A0AAD6X5D1_9AGAR|nr:extracellular exo-polygalacturonase [Mycena alexandri]